MGRPCPRDAGRAARALAACLAPLCSACTLGLDDSGDESGLTRLEYEVPGHPDRSISYLIHGNTGRPRMIFVHGSPGNSAMYAPYLQDPIEGLETIAVDGLG